MAGGFKPLARVQDYSGVVMLMLVSLLFFLRTLATNPLLILSPSKLRHAHFSAFLGYVGPQMASNETHNDAISKRLLTHVRGVVLDVGPGAGDPLHVFAPFVHNVDTVYGIEPNAMLHPQLLRNASKAGFNEPAAAAKGKGRYVPLECGIEPGSLVPSLSSVGLHAEKGAVVDAVVSIKALCSSPQAELPLTIDTLFRLLKPGGELLMFEHVANDEDTVTSCVQRLMNIIWPTAIGGCTLRGQLARLMRAEAKKGPSRWEKLEVGRLNTHVGYEIVSWAVIRAVRAR